MMLQNPGTWRPPAHENIVGFRPDEPEVSEEGWGAEVTWLSPWAVSSLQSGRKWESCTQDSLMPGD